MRHRIRKTLLIVAFLIHFSLHAAFLPKLCACTQVIGNLIPSTLPFSEITIFFVAIWCCYCYMLWLVTCYCYITWNHRIIHPLNVYFMKNSFCLCNCKFIRTLCKIMRLRYRLIPMKLQLIMLSKMTSSFWWMPGLQDTSWVGLFLSEVKIMRLKLKSFENCMQVILLSLV